MGFFSSASSAVSGRSSGKLPNGMTMKEMLTGKRSKKENKTTAGAVAGSAPIDNSHSHSTNKNTGNSSTGDGGVFGKIARLAMKPDNSSFMTGKVKEKFDSLTDTSSLDRSGRAISPDSLDPVGIEPAMNPPMAVPIDIDREGTMNSLYS